MRMRSPSVLFGLALLTSTVTHADPATPPAAAAKPKETPMTQHATGTFKVDLVPLTVNESVADDLRARMSINKTFSGDLEARSVGEMLTAGTPTRGSAAYVAIERVTGTLHGRSGAFSLQHTGVMNRGTPSLDVTIVPDSGSGELEGIVGTLAIIIADGKHSYDLAYTLSR
jgi:hypothetical protein